MFQVFPGAVGVKAETREESVGELRRERGVGQVRRGCEDGEGERALEVEEAGEVRLSERWVLQEKRERQEVQPFETDG